MAHGHEREGHDQDKDNAARHRHAAGPGPADGHSHGDHPPGDHDHEDHPDDGHEHGDHPHGGHSHAEHGAHEHADAHARGGHDHDDGHEHGGHDHVDGHEHGDHRHGGGEDHGHEHGGLWGALTHFFRPHSHDAADSIDDAMAGSDEGIRAVKISLLGLGVTAIAQLVITLMSGSVALLADTIHNFADASTAIPLWLAFSISRRPPNRRYTYGYGRAEDLAGVFVILMITGSALIAAYESIQKLRHPEPIGLLGWVAAAGLLGFVGNELVAQYRIRTGERIGSAALIADGYHARTDGFTSLAVLLGAGGVWLGYPIADPIVGLVITIAILLVLKDAVRQIWQRLMDAVDPEIVAKAERAARETEGVESVSSVRARWIGHTIHGEAQIVADQGLRLAEAHAIGERARHAMLHAVPRLTSVTVHVDPCGHDGHDHHADVAHHDERSPLAGAPAADG
jgi:cation diffusion facilitator family transporter